MRRFGLLLLMALAAVSASSVSAAPALTDTQRQVLEDTVADGDAPLDQGPAIYQLLENAGDWQQDDFAGERGAATPPKPDVAYLLENPAEVRGDLFLIEGVFHEQIRYPADGRDGRGHLSRAGHPVWGDQLTCWGIRVGDSADDVVLVYFIDPDGSIAAPKPGDEVRIAARFYRVWRVPDRDGRDFSFLTFVGGAREVVTGGGGSGGSSGMGKIVLVLVVVAAGGFYGMRLLLAKKSSAQRARSEAMREARHREHEDDEEDIDPDLPDDPAEALEYLQAKEQANDQ